MPSEEVTDNDKLSPWALC